MTGNAHQRRVRKRAADRNAAAIEAEYADYLASVDCSCCPSCNITPCPGSAAGGFCDDLCFCGGYDAGDDADEEDEPDDAACQCHCMCRGSAAFEGLCGRCREACPAVPP